MLYEVNALFNNGIFAMNALNLDFWMFDRRSFRVYFLSPFWLTDSASKADELTFGKLKLEELHQF